MSDVGDIPFGAYIAHVCSILSPTTMSVYNRICEALSQADIDTVYATIEQMTIYMQSTLIYAKKYEFNSEMIKKYYTNNYTF